MQEWCVLTIDLKRLAATSPLLAGRRGRAITPVENVVFFARTDDIEGLDGSSAKDVTVHEYDVVGDRLRAVLVRAADIAQAGEVYHAHPSLITARSKLAALDEIEPST